MRQVPDILVCTPRAAAQVPCKAQGLLVKISGVDFEDRDSGASRAFERERADLAAVLTRTGGLILCPSS